MKCTWLPLSLLDPLWSPQVINGRAAVGALGTLRTVRLGELCDTDSGQYIDEYAAPMPGRGTAPYIRVDNIRPFVANMNRADLAYIHTDHPAVFARSILQAGDVAIARTGTLGKAALAVGELVGGVISQHVTRLTVRKSLREVVSPAFLCAFLNSGPGRSQLLALGAGSTRRELTQERLADLRVPLVARARHDEVTSLVQQGAQDLARAGQEIRRAIDLYNAVFDGGPAEPSTPRLRVWMTPSQVEGRWTPRFHCDESVSWLANLPANYELRPLGELAAGVRGKGARRADYASSGVPFIRTTSLINGGIDPFPDHYASEETYARYRQQTEEGDLLLSIEGKIGQVAYLTDADRGVFKNHIELLRPRDRSLAPHIFLALASEVGQSQMRRLTVVQATLPGLASRSRRILIPIPRAEAGDHARAMECLLHGFQLRTVGLLALGSAVARMRKALADPGC